MEYMIRQTKRTLLLLLAAFFALIGLLGLILPLIPGLPFLAVALVLITLFFPSLREWTHVRTKKFPPFHKIMIKMEDWIQGIVGEL
jgi:uncharacterized membrane protein YbaN (DUF454 family)